MVRGTSYDPTGDGQSIPSALLALVPVASTLVTVATNPIQFLRGPVLQIVVDALLIKPAAWVFGYILEAAYIVENALLSLPPILTKPFIWIANPIVGAVTGLYGGLRGILMSLGLAAPIASAVAIAIGLVILLTLAVAIWRLIPGSDILDGVTQWTS